MNDGVSQSISATHNGSKSLRPHRGNNASCFRSPLPEQSTGLSKSYVISLQRIVLEVVENGCQVAFTGVGQQCHNLFALVLGALCNL